MNNILTFKSRLFIYDQINEDMPSNFEMFSLFQKTNTHKIQRVEKIIPL